MQFALLWAFLSGRDALSAEAGLIRTHTMYREMRVSGWGRVKSGTSMIARPERVRDVQRLFETAGSRQVCSRGAGRSYGDCGLNSGGIVVDTDRLARILSFNEETGEIAVEPGVTFERLLRVFVPRGWLAPVSPGTAFATIGGAVANDVHGKNHEHAGSFGQHIVEMDVVTPDGETHSIGPERRPEWFRATVGGVGLTGILTRIVFRMMRVSGPCVLVTRKRVERSGCSVFNRLRVRRRRNLFGGVDRCPRPRQTSRARRPGNGRSCCGRGSCSQESRSGYRDRFSKFRAEQTVGVGIQRRVFSPGSGGGGDGALSLRGFSLSARSNRKLDSYLRQTGISSISMRDSVCWEGF